VRGGYDRAMEQLLADIARARIGTTFNQYAGNDGAVRLANLARYLDERRGARVLALGEAAGYQGMRWSGIAFTSERDLLRWGRPYRTRTPPSQCNALSRRASGASGTSPTATPYFQSGGQMAMKRA